MDEEAQGYFERVNDGANECGGSNGFRDESDECTDSSGIYAVGFE